MVEPGKIAKNTIYLTAATVGQKVLAFLYFILIARLAQVEGTGKYFFVVSFTTIFSVLIDLGLSTVLVREVARNKEKAGRYLSNILGVKVFLGFLTYLAVIITINILGYPTSIKIMVYLAGIVMLLDSFHLTFFGIFRGLQNLKYEAIAVVIGQIIIITIGGASLLLGAPLYFLIIALIAGSAFDFLFAAVLLRFKAGLRLRLSWNKKIIFFLFKMAYPFALAGIFVKVYSYLDSVLLSKMIGDMAVGWWSVAYKITYAFQFIPMAFAAAMFPAMSAYFVSDRGRLKQTFERAIFYLALVGIPIAFGIFSLAEPIILKLYGASYAASILPLQIAIFSIIFIFLNFPVGSLLGACDRQMTNTAIMGVAMGINVILNLILIPIFSFIGAAVSAVISHFILFILGLIFVNKIVAYDKKFIFGSFSKIILSAGLMSLTVIYLKSYIHFIILIPLGALIHFGILFLTRGFEKKDVVNVLKMLKREPAVEMVDGESKEI